MTEKKPELTGQFDAAGDDETDRAPYSHNEGRYIGPHEDNRSPVDDSDFMRRVRDRIRSIKERKERARERGDYGRERTLEP